ncbi:MAG: hypothetical protein F4110_01245 [Acidimicrobiaceae bacterium]|nr:hypothetical protein [Acidimicrobiaceae bacterium]MYI52613.1 hypothetical protein [Acidimicrobiaceae bacterium]
MDLSGTWRVAAATEGRRRTFHEFDHDDSRWAEMQVPGHWAQPAAGGEGSHLAVEESVLYRHRFEGPPEAIAAGGEDETNVEDETTVEDAVDGADDPAGGLGRRWWLRIEGLAQQGDVWLDGSYLGHTDGYFVPHELEVTEQLAARSEHLLAIEATCRRFGDPDNRTLLTGALQDPELCGVDDLIVGGVWRPVRLRSTGRIAIRHARAVCADVSTGENRARLELRAVLDVPGGGPVDLGIRVAGTEHVHSHHAADGENRVEWSVDVDDPPLWWPHALGEQHLCDLVMEALTGTKVHDRRHFRIGFRSVAMRRWVLYVNGERLFVKGANLLPTRPLLGTATASEVADDIRAARNAGLDLVRPVAHIARPELYDAADELGVLVWQDLPVRGLMSRSVADEASRQAREAVDLLGHRPSVAVWCAHDQPYSRSRRPGRTPAVVRRQGPSWNRDLLDRRLGRVLDRCDGSRPVVSHTGVPPRAPLLDGTTSELWFGLHGGRAADAGPVLARVPAMARFVSAFGTPVADDQPEVVKSTIETLRRLKYRPTGGFLLHALADAGGSERAAAVAGTDGGFGVLDGLRRPKPGWWALQEACRPLIAVADQLPESVGAGEVLDLAVHVVNDTRADVPGMQVQARMLGPDGRVVREHRWEGTARADDCVMVGRLSAVVPVVARPGQLTLELTLTGRAGADGEPAPVATNRYTTVIS